MPAPPTSYHPDLRTQGPQVEAGWGAANIEAIREKRWSEDELRRYVAATTIAALDLSGEGEVCGSFFFFFVLKIL